MMTILKKMLRSATIIFIGSLILDIVLDRGIHIPQKLLISVLGGILLTGLEICYEKYFKK
jgi:hypothetical protein